MEFPRTSKCYLLPKIHQTDNPDRPIVSAWACPTEKLAVIVSGQGNNPFRTRTWKLSERHYETVKYTELPSAQQ